MKRFGHIRRTAATSSLWRKLKKAKARQDYPEVGRLTAEIHKHARENGNVDDTRNV
jgi:hypothetical protein